MTGSAGTTIEAGNDETAEIGKVTVEGLVRYAHRRLEAAGLVVGPSKVSKTVRRLFRQVGPTAASLVIDNWVRELSADPAFNTDVLLTLSYADPTGNTAARNVDRNRKS